MEDKHIEQEIAALEDRLRKLKAQHASGRGGNFFMAFSVIVGAAIVGSAFLYSGRIGGGDSAVRELGGAAVKKEEKGFQYVRPVQEGDHIRGAADASVVLVEFSDAECPFCKRFHETLKDIVESYDGRVAWVYRHFPLDGLHSKARTEAEALECAGELGGSGKFWEYADRLFEVTPSNDGLDPAELPRIAEYVGVDRSVFEACLRSGRYAEKVERDLRDAQRSGGTGTPYTVILKDGVPVSTIEGALPYYSVKLSIEEVLR